MSALLVLLFLVGTAAIVWSACFVGCSFDPGKGVSDYYQYQKTVTTTPGLVAFWPLDDTSGTVAVDLGPNHFNGTYTIGPDVPAYNAAQQSDASPGTFALNQANIVPGDTTSTDGNAAPANPCVNFNGGFVSVPWQAALGPPAPAKFTLEAWVVPNWTLADAQADPSFRSVVNASADTAAGFTGFALYASPDNLWTVTIGIGTQNATATTGNNQTIVQGSLYFLVVTYDGSTLTLWVNPADTTQPPDGTAPASGYVPVASPVPLYIGTGSPQSPTPLFPFNGNIQDVAFYNVVLDGQTIETHYLNGSGMQDP
jgi:Concanavalin A-like lectin/glucanases superfamily